MGQLYLPLWTTYAVGPTEIIIVSQSLKIKVSPPIIDAWLTIN